MPPRRPAPGGRPEHVRPISAHHGSCPMCVLVGCVTSLPRVTPKAIHGRIGPKSIYLQTEKPVTAPWRGVLVRFLAAVKTKKHRRSLDWAPVLNQKKVLTEHRNENNNASATGKVSSHKKAMNQPDLFHDDVRDETGAKSRPKLSCPLPAIWLRQVGITARKDNARMHLLACEGLWLSRLRAEEMSS